MELFYDAISCKKDCNFDIYIKTANAKSAFSKSANDGEENWKKDIFKKMNKKVQPMCRKSLKLTAPKDASAIKSDIGKK